MNTPSPWLAMLCACSTLSAQWTPLVPSPSPSLRAGPSMAADLNGNTILHGGMTTLFAPVVISGETWRFDGSTWQLLAPASTPGPRYGASLVFDNVRNVFVLFGGRPSLLSMATNETWEFDGVNWTQASPTWSPPALVGHAACFDVARARVVVYGGVSGFAASANTYEYDGTTWQQVGGAGAPGPIDQPAMCYDWALGRTVLFGGADPLTGLATDTTWLYDGVAWTQAQIAGQLPTVRYRAEMVYDVARGVCLLVGGDTDTSFPLGDTWQFDGASWQSLGWATYGAADFGLAYDLAHQNAYRFGGVVSSSVLTGGQTEVWGATTLTIGAGCPGSAGVPLLQATTSPHLGGTWHLLLSNLVPGIPIAALVIGLSHMPEVALAGIGMPGCTAYARPDVLLALPANGTATWATGVPMSAAFVGLQLLAQGLSLDPGANPAGLTTSNAAGGILGW